jgi:hypothetical protein
LEDNVIYQDHDERRAICVRCAAAYQEQIRQDHDPLGQLVSRKGKFTLYG